MRPLLVLCSLIVFSACDGAQAPTTADGAASASATPTPMVNGNPHGMPLDSIHIEAQAGNDAVFEVDDDAIFQVLALAQAGALPLVATGDSYRVTSALTGSVVALAGLRVLDEVTHVNGVPVNDPQLLRKAYVLLRSANTINLSLRRGGEATTLTYEVRGRRRPRPAARAFDGRGDVSGDAPPPLPRSRPTSRQPLDPKLAEGIRRIDDTHYELKRSAVDTMLSDQAALMRSARIVPAMKDGKAVGIKLYGIRRSSLFSALGFKNGDQVTAVNGMEVHDPSKALEAYAKLRGAKQVEVSIERRGVAMVIAYRVVD